MVMMLIGNRLMSDFFEIDFLDVELKQMIPMVGLFSFPFFERFRDGTNPQAGQPVSPRFVVAQFIARSCANCR